MGFRETLDTARAGVTNNRESIKQAIDDAPDDAIIVLVMTAQSNDRANAMELLTMANAPKVIGLAVLTAAAMAASGAIKEGVESVAEHETGSGDPDDKDCGDPDCHAHQAERDVKVKVTPGVQAARA